MRARSSSHLSSIFSCDAHPCCTRPLHSSSAAQAILGACLACGWGPMDTPWTHSRILRVVLQYVASPGRGAAGLALAAPLLADM